jgi:hypothetical protein
MLLLPFISRAVTSLASAGFEAVGVTERPVSWADALRLKLKNEMKRISIGNIILRILIII